MWSIGNAEMAATNKLSMKKKNLMLSLFCSGFGQKGLFVNRGYSWGFLSLMKLLLVDEGFGKHKNDGAQRFIHEDQV